MHVPKSPRASWRAPAAAALGFLALPGCTIIVVEAGATATGLEPVTCMAGSCSSGSASSSTARTPTTTVSLPERLQLDDVDVPTLIEVPPVKPEAVPPPEGGLG